MQQDTVGLKAKVLCCFLGLVCAHRAPSTSNAAVEEVYDTDNLQLMLADVLHSGYCLDAKELRSHL